MLCVLFLLCGLSGLSTDYDSERLHVQITVPEKIRSIASGGRESHVSYNIVIEGKTYTVNLMRTTFLPHNFRVYGYNGTGIMKPLEQQFQNFCYYQGYIEGYPNSMAIVSTCTGLRGILQFENVSYGIEPLESSIGFEHVIYQVKHKNAGIYLYAGTDIESRDLPYKIQSVEPQLEFSRYVEMHAVVEKNLYDHMGADTSVVTQKIFQLIGLTNAIFTSFNITIILSSLELWIDENKILTTGDANELLHSYREKPNYVGATFQGKMCDKNYAGGVALHPRTISLESLAVILAQLLSLSMGIAYDDINKCQCSGAVCIMNPEAIHSSGVKTFSNCSMEDFAYFISNPKSQCLQNQPHLDPYYKQETCGNGVLEQGESCDCGSEQECNDKGNTCCNSGTCTFTDGSNCDEGPCCSNCVFSSKGTECRPAINDCDLPEYCNGSSAQCQSDVFVQNGHACGNGQWLCVDKVCRSGKQQCVDTFGSGAEFGTEECYNQLNSMTDQSGNCGSGPSGYVQCKPKDRKCGKLLCKYGNDNLIVVHNATIIYANIDGNICIALEYAHDDKNSKMMWVNDGTVCGTNMVCRNKACVSSAYLDYDCTEDKCNNHGVCNNKKNCHCDTGYLPPNCETMNEGWPGGSVDSGNFPTGRVNIPERHYIENAYHSRPTKWPFFLLIPFFIILCVLIAILVKVHFQRKKWRTEDYTSNELSLENKKKMSMDSLIS